MKSIAFLLFIAFALSSPFANAQKQGSGEDDIILKSDGKMLTISISDPQLKNYDLLIYKSYEEIVFNKTDLSTNPVMVDISTWKPGVYHIKIDYNRTTQFRHYEVVKE